MKIQTIRENSEPFGTEYSCMMALIIHGKLVIVRTGSEEFKQIEKLVMSSKRLSPNGVPKEASEEDIAFFINQFRNSGTPKT